MVQHLLGGENLRVRRERERGEERDRENEEREKRKRERGVLLSYLPHATSEKNKSGGNDLDLVPPVSKP